MHEGTLTGCRHLLKDSARPTLDKINLKNRQHAPAKSARPFNVECAPSMSGPRETVWARAGLKIRDCRHWRGGACKYLVLIAIHSQIFLYTFPISTTCLRLILSMVVRFKSLIARSSHVAFECPRFPTHSIPLPLVDVSRRGLQCSSGVCFARPVSKRCHCGLLHCILIGTGATRAI